MDILPPLAHSRAPLNHQQTGTAIVEMLLVLLPVLLTGSLCLELARGYQVRHLLTLSLHQAARIAAVHHAAPHKWQPALEDSISLLFVPPGRYQSPQARRDAARQSHTRRFGLPLWQATQLASSHDTIHLRLTYLHSPMQEWLRRMLQALFNMIDRQERALEPQHTVEQRAWRQGLIPIVVEYRILRHRSLNQP
jgi:hypothetical protein